MVSGVKIATVVGWQIFMLITVRERAKIINGIRYAVLTGFLNDRQLYMSLK